MWSDVVKGLKKENSDKSGNESETTDLVEKFDTEDSNQLKVKQLKRHRKRCYHRVSEGADKGLTCRQADRRVRDAHNQWGQEALDRRHQGKQNLTERGA